MFGLLIAAAMLNVPDLPAFTFRAIKAGEVLPASASKGCSKERSGVRYCTSIFDKVAGKSAVVVIGIYNDRLSSLGISTNRTNYRDLLLAFNEKYGAPCETRSDVWKNAVGASVANSIVVWCFSTGKLELREIGSTLSRSEASYTDMNAPTPAAKVDF